MGTGGRPARGRSRPGVGLALSAAAILALSLGACGSDGSGRPDAGSFERELVEREEITSAQARCVRQDLFSELSDGSLADLQSGGFAALPRPDWTAYGHAMVGCALGGELGVEGAPR